MSLLIPGVLEGGVPLAGDAQDDALASSSLEFDLMLEPDVSAPPAYVQYDEYPPPYQHTMTRPTRGPAVFHQISLQDMIRFDESNRQQELQLLLGVLLSIVVTLFLMDGLPMLGQPTSSMHAIRIYGWFAVAFLLSILLATVSLLCKYWLTRNHLKLAQSGPQESNGVPETRFQAAEKYVMNGLIASGSTILYTMALFFGVGLVDFFWQLYPSFGAGIFATCGLYGSGPILSAFGHEPLYKLPLISAMARHSWRFARTWLSRGSTANPRQEDDAVERCAL